MGTGYQWSPGRFDRIQNPGFKTVTGKVKEYTEFIKYIDNYEGLIFDNSKLGKTKQQVHLELKSDASPHPPPAKYIPLNPYMRQEARKLVEQMVDLDVLEPTTKPASGLAASCRSLPQPAAT